MTGVLLDLRQVSVTFSSGPPWQRSVVQALQEVDLRIAPGETVGLVGESGSGKTTLGRICLGLQVVSSGTVTFDGRPLVAGRHRDLKGKLAAVLQHPKSSLNPSLTIAASVAEPLLIRRQGTATERRRRAEAMLERVGLGADLARRHPHELSGGQRQRVSIARALVTEPRFLLFDEAVSALDVSVQAQILNLIRALQAELGFAALFISHDIAATRYVASRIIVMYRGVVVEDCAATALYRTAVHPYTRCLQQASGLIDAPLFQLGPSIEDVPLGRCRLAPRCPLVQERCRAADPPLRPLDDRLVACHRAAELAGAGQSLEEGASC